MDILLLHESPLNVNPSIEFAHQVIKEIDRIRPKFVFAGHTDEYLEKFTPGEIKIITLEGIAKGYGVLDLLENGFRFQRIIARYR